MRTEKEEAGGNNARNPRESREAIFRTVRGALMFAMNFTHGTLKKSALAEMIPGRVGRGLGGLDGAAQAGMILTELGRVRQRRRSIVTARCAPPSLPCGCKSQCCRGWRENAQWSEAINDLTGYVLEEGLASVNDAARPALVVSHYRVRRAMVARYFLGKTVAVGFKQGLAEVAQQCGVHRNTVSAHNKAVVEHLKREEQLATYEVEGLLKDAGIIE